METMRAANLSAAANKRWRECEDAAKHLGCKKAFVHDKLYTKLKATELLTRVCAGDSDACEQVKTWPEFNVGLTLNLWQPAPNDVPKSALEKLKVARWFIVKMGGVEQARKAIDAVEAVEKALS